MKKFELKSCTPIEAQKECNFVVFEPTSLPSDLSIKEQNLRMESKLNKDRRENNRSSFRQVFEGDDRRLVVKQFLYDWAPPAYDYPCLWRNDEIATKAESPAPKGQFVNNNVLWFGKNYRKQDAATIEIERTRIEMTFEKDEFLNSEIALLCESFIAVDPKRRKEILERPFSELSYSHRYEDLVVSVPVGFWKYSRAEDFICYALNNAQIPTETLLAIKPLREALEKRNYRLNSGFGFGKDKTQFEEIELIFEHQESPGSFVRILTTKANSPFSITVPPTLSDQECSHKTLNFHGNPFYYATSKNFEFGSHEIVFKTNEFNCMLLIKPAPWTSIEWLTLCLYSIYSSA